MAATGALNVAAADGVDSYRNRALRMLASSAIGAAAVTIGALSAGNEAAAIGLGVLWAFTAGLVVCLGTATADIGMISLVVFVIYNAQSMTPRDAAWAGLIALAGGLFQTGLSIALWPVRGRQPERRVIGDFYRELARAATATPDPYGAPLASQQSTQAQEALSSLRGDHSLKAERLFMLVGEGERIRLALFALSRSLVRVRREAGGEREASAIQDFLELAARLLASVGTCLEGEPPSGQVSAWLRQLEDAVQALRQSEDGTDHPSLQALLSEARIQMDALAGQLRAAVELATSATPAGELAFAAREARTPWHLQFSGWLATLHANLSMDSSACRHAIRLALCIAIGDLITRSFSLPRSYWLNMTVALVLKPDFGNTFSRGVLRLAGTYAGLMAPLLFRLASPTVPVRVLWIGILTLGMRSLGRANYGILVTILSALVVVLFSLIGVAPRDVIASRALNTSIGGLLTLAIYLVWPTRERTQVPPAWASMLDAYRLYFQAVARAYLEGRSLNSGELDRVRTDARRARSNLETSIDRFSAEPFADADQVRVLNSVLASSHRFIHAAMALEAALPSSPPQAAGEAFQNFSHDVEKILYFLAARLRGSAVERENLPDLREDHNRLIRSGDNLLNIETDRITNTLNTHAELLFQWVGRVGRIA